MTIYPAVDISGGRCVRLRRGDRSALTDYGDPLEIAARYKEEGAEFLHVVDLDGAFGTGDNSILVARVRSEVGLPVQVGGGIRSRGSIENYLGGGVDRVILGTAALEDEGLVRWAVRAWPGKIACGLDARDGRAALRGWVDQSDLDVLAAAERLAAIGVDTFIYTDISRDGMMSGPDVGRTRALVEAISADIIGSGGVSRLEDVEALRGAGASGCIIGRALLDGAFALPQAIACAKEPC